MNIPSLLNNLPVLIEAGEPVMLKGPVGVGKTDILKKVSEILSYDLMICHPVVGDPTDYKGMPAIIDGKATWIPFGDLERMMTATEPLIVFFDDLGQATKIIQSAVMQIVLERAINGQRISEHVRFVMATNRRNDKAGVQGIITPLLSRISTILSMEVNPDAWCDWAYENQMPSELIAFIQFRPELLHDFDPKKVDASGDSLINQPCPRTVAASGRLFNLGLRDFEIFQGSVGEAFATEFLSFVSRIEKLGDLPARIIKGEDPECPEDVSTLFALSSCLARLIEKNGFEKIGKWVMDRLPEEFAVRFLKDAEKLHGEKVTGAKGYVDLSIKINGFLSA